MAVTNLSVDRDLWIIGVEPHKHRSIDFPSSLWLERRLHGIFVVVAGLEASGHFVVLSVGAAKRHTEVVVVPVVRHKVKIRHYSCLQCNEGYLETPIKI